MQTIGTTISVGLSTPVVLNDLWRVCSIFSGDFVNAYIPSSMTIYNKFTCSDFSNTSVMTLQIEFTFPKVIKKMRQKFTFIIYDNQWKY